MFEKACHAGGASPSRSRLSGCGYNTLQQQDERHQGRLVRGGEPVPAPRRSRAEPRQHGEGLRRAGGEVLSAVTNARSNVAGIKATPELINDPVAFQKFQRRPERAAGRAVAPAAGRRELPEPQVRRAVPRPAGAARGHREPDHGRAQPLHRERAGLQHDGALVPDQPDGDAVQDGREAQLHRRERGGDREPPTVDFGKTPARAGARTEEVGAPSRGRQDRRRCRSGRRPDEEGLLIARRPRGGVAVSPGRRRPGPRRAAARHDAPRSSRAPPCSARSPSGRRARRRPPAWEGGSDGLKPVPPLSARVTDLTATLSPAERAVARREARGVRAARPARSSSC